MNTFSVILLIIIAAKNNKSGISFSERTRAVVRRDTVEGQGWVGVTALPLTGLCLHLFTSYLENRVILLHWRSS